MKIFSCGRTHLTGENYNKSEHDDDDDDGGHDKEKLWETSSMGFSLAVEV